MEELKDTKLPEPDTEAPETPPIPIPSQKPAGKRPDRFWLGVAVGAVAAALVAAILTVLLWPAPTVETVTVRETVYVTAETVAPTLPPPEANPLGPEDFTFENGFLTCTARPSVLGLDLSTHQKSVDWQTVRNAGVEFVMLRAGFRGYGVNSGVVDMDAMVRSHYAGAKAVGMKVGFYFFSQATSVAEAVEEANYLLTMLQNEGWQVDMPIVYDWEYMGEGTRTEHVDARTVTDCAKAFCEMIRRAGYEPMVYFNSDQSRDNMELAELTDYKFWLAMYTYDMTYEYRVDMWQYTQTGTVPGIEGNVDIDLYFPEY